MVQRLKSLVHIDKAAKCQVRWLGQAATLARKSECKGASNRRPWQLWRGKRPRRQLAAKQEQPIVALELPPLANPAAGDSEPQRDNNPSLTINASDLQALTDSTQPWDINQASDIHEGTGGNASCDEDPSETETHVSVSSSSVGDGQAADTATRALATQFPASSQLPLPADEGLLPQSACGSWVASRGAPPRGLSFADMLSRMNQDAVLEAQMQHTLRLEKRNAAMAARRRKAKATEQAPAQRKKVRARVRQGVATEVGADLAAPCVPQKMAKFVEVIKLLPPEAWPPTSAKGSQNYTLTHSSSSTTICVRCEPFCFAHVGHGSHGTTLHLLCVPIIT